MEPTMFNSKDAMDVGMRRDDGLASSEEVRYALVPSGPAPSAEEVETRESAVEIIVMWGNSAVLQVDHLSPVRSYYVGDGLDDKGRPMADYVLSADSLGVERMPVVLEDRGTLCIVIAPQTAGDVVVRGERRDLASLVRDGHTRPCAELSGAHQYPLPAGATARVMLGELTFVVRPVHAGKAVGKQGAHTIDWRQHRWTLASFAFFGLFLSMGYLMPPKAACLCNDWMNADLQLAKYLLVPTESTDPDTPDWLDTPTPDESEGGDGKRHEGEEGQMGKQEAKKSKNKYGIFGPPDNPEPHMAHDIAREQARNAGILGVIASSMGAVDSPTSPFGEATALGYDPVSAMGAMLGDNIGENFGFNGLGLRGTGRRGGGTGEGTIGLGNLGTMGHGAGGGTGTGYGRGAGGMRGRQASVPRIRSGNAEVRGSLSKEVIRRTIQRHINEVRFCYEQELTSRPDLSGRVQVKFVIAPSGVVQAANVESSSLGSVKAEGCIAKAVNRWSFPAPDGGGVVIVSYPFVFEAAGG